MIECSKNIFAEISITSLELKIGNLSKFVEKLFEKLHDLLLLLITAAKHVKLILFRTF
jgi:hypothetical protein